MISVRTPLAPTEPTIAAEVHCASRFCERELTKNVIYFRGYGYCSKACRKEWPPTVLRIQTEYDAPIEVVLTVALGLFRSKRRVADILQISSTSLDKLVSRFKLVGK